MKMICGRCVARELDGLEAAGRGDDADAGALEQAGQDVAVGRAVVDDQRRERSDPARAWRRAAAAPTRGRPVRRAPSAVPATSGSVNQKRLPSPSTLSTFSSPPILVIR